MSKNNDDKPNLPAVPPVEPIKFSCGNCSIRYTMGKETTVYLYNKQVWFNHLVTNCVKCGREYTVWYLSVAEAQFMMKHNMGDKADLMKWVVADYCDDMQVIREFCETNHKNLPPDLWLSPRRGRRIDSQVAWFRYLLDNGETP